MVLFSCSYSYIVSQIEYVRHTDRRVRCEHFVKYEGATTMIGINIAALMMLFRIDALYRNNRPVVAVVALVFVAEAATNAWLLASGHGAYLFDSYLSLVLMIVYSGACYRKDWWYV